MSSVIIRPGQRVGKDPSDERVYTFDWDTDNLATAATITQSTWSITVVSGSDSPVLTKDNEAVLTGSRKTQLRLKGGGLGAEYEIANKIVTSETPTQTKERSFRVLIAQR